MKRKYRATHYVIFSVLLLVLSYVTCFPQHYVLKIPSVNANVLPQGERQNYTVIKTNM
jgi:hypothetical protein